MADLKVRAGGAWRPASKFYTKVGGSLLEAKATYVKIAGAWAITWSAAPPNPYQNLINPLGPRFHIPEAFGATPAQILEETSDYWLIKAVNRSAVGFNLPAHVTNQYTIQIPVEIVSSTFDYPDLGIHIWDGNRYTNRVEYMERIGVKSTLFTTLSLSEYVQQVHVLANRANQDHQGEIIYKLYKTSELTLALFGYTRYYPLNSASFAEKWEDPLNNAFTEVRTTGPNSGVEFPVYNLRPNGKYKLHLELEFKSGTKFSMLRVGLFNYTTQSYMYQDLITHGYDLNIRRKHTVEFTLPSNFNEYDDLWLQVIETTGTASNNWRVHREGTRLEFLEMPTSGGGAV